MNTHRNYRKIAQALAYIRAHFQEQPELSQVAEHVHLSPYHFQKVFKQWAGVSPKKFLQYITLNHAKALLYAHPKISLLETSGVLGLSSASRLHDLFIQIEGMTPADFKNKGAGLHIKYQYFDSRFGRVMIAATDKGVCHITFDVPKNALYTLRQMFPHAILLQGSNRWQQRAALFLQTHRIQHDLKLHLKGSAFQLKVWEALLSIAEGEVLTYSEVATQIEQAKAVRAVGSAIAKNPIAILIPCHRVICKNGEIGQYRWGEERKGDMLAWECVQSYLK